MSSRRAKQRRRKARPARRNKGESQPDVIPEGYGADWDHDFAFIAGFTSGGAPFGTSWEEVAALDEDEPALRRDHQPSDRAPETDQDDDNGQPIL